MPRTFGFCQVAMSGALAFGGALLGAGGSAWAQGGPALKWAAHEMWPGADAHDEGVDIVHWYDPVLDRHWVFVTGFVTEVIDGVVVGTRFATFKYDAVNTDPQNPQPVERAYFPPDLKVPTDGIYKAVAMALDEETGDIYVTGEAKRPNGSDQDYAIIRYDKDLDPKWTPMASYFNGPVSGDDIPADIGLDPAHVVVVVTGTSPGGNTQKDIATIALHTQNGAPAGNLWPDVNNWGEGVRRYDFFGGDDRAVELGGVNIAEDGPQSFTGAPSPQLTVVILGTSWGGSVTHVDTTTHVWSGPGATPLWDRRIETNHDEHARGLWVEGAYIFITGFVVNQFAGGWCQKWVTAAYDWSGQLHWQREWEHQGGCDAPYDIAAVSGNGVIHVLVTGYAWSGTTEVHLATVRYEGFTGDQEWVDVWSHPAATLQVARAIALFGNDLYITGLWGTALDHVMLGMKYAFNPSPPPPYLADWSAGYGDAGFAGDGGGRAVVAANVGGRRMVFITGAAFRDGQGHDFATLCRQE